jgi:hypothetical protein
VTLKSYLLWYDNVTRRSRLLLVSGSTDERSRSRSGERRRSPIPSNMAHLRQVAADMAIGSELLRAEGLTQNAMNHYETITSDSSKAPSPSLASRPQTLTADHGSGSSETTITPRTMMNETGIHRASQTSRMNLPQHIGQFRRRKSLAFYLSMII